MIKQGKGNKNISRASINSKNKGENREYSFIEG